MAAQALGREVGLVVGSDDAAVLIDEVLVGVGDADRGVGVERRQHPLDGDVDELVVVVEERDDVAGRHRQGAVRRRDDAGVGVGEWRLRTRGSDAASAGSRRRDERRGRAVVDEAPLPTADVWPSTEAMHASNAASGGLWTGVSMLRRDPDRLGWTTAPT